MRQWVRRAASVAVVSLSAGVAGLLQPVPALAVSPDIVISQVYGGGGTVGATYTNDFVELFNRGASAVDVSGWSVQYASAVGSTWQVTPLTGTIQPGSYYLVQQGQGGGGTTPLPTPDAVDDIAMSATSGKVALLTNQTALTCSVGCATAPGVRDFVGYGVATSSETLPAPALSNTTAALRDDDGDVDTDNNAVDFAVGAPDPRNSAQAPDEANLSVTKTDSPDPVTAGQNLTYTITVANAGPAGAQAVVLTDNLPAGTTFVSAVFPASWSATTPPVGSGGTVTVSTASLADGATATITLTVNVGASTTGPLTNTASVGSDTADPDPGDNSATATTSVGQPWANLAITKIDAPDPVTAGSNLTYTIAVRNNGPDAAQTVVMRDEIPAGTSFVSFTSPAGWTASTPPVGGTGEVSATKATMGNAESATFTLVVAVAAATTGTISNSSGVTSATFDPVLANNGDTEITQVGPGTPACTITGTERGDILNGTLSDDVICGLGGNDIISGRGGNDIIYGGPGSDLINGGPGDDRVYGEAGNDFIKIRDKVTGNDNADGGPGFDLCSADLLDAVLSCP
ncbi:lamin tail domain-containing protein [Catellatospora methionotrophica]|uniref:lamin tail domain-containing protein n=1 Tax=Catellatospora methionotrophica TaxID=121620 RepID=UPI0033E1DCB5